MKISAGYDEEIHIEVKGDEAYPECQVWWSVKVDFATKFLKFRIIVQLFSHRTAMVHFCYKIDDLCLHKK